MTINYQKFTENNIQFRIISSKLIERYKSTQSFVLSEMLHGQYNFSKTSREIALLAMDITFAWLIGLENYLIRDNSPFFDKKACLFSLRSMRKADRYWMNVIDNHEDIFEKKITKVWKEIHNLKMNIAKKVIESCEGLSDLEAFSVISNYIIEAMDALKFELYEIDYIVNNPNGQPFLCFTDLCIVAKEELNIDYSIEKANIYISKFDIKDGFIFKNYSQELNPITYVMNLEKHGIVIKNKKIKSNGYMYA